ncbi:MAG TPA: shikimate kinase [Jiangellaceae bacterium]|nr:shikimate kinase [Jiangellaceae bacterium]
MAVARVLLLGLMGSGKTTVGRALAGRLGWPYVDNDDLVEEFAGDAKASLVESRGAARLRTAEARALHTAMSRPGPFVAGVAAGVVLDADDAAPLKDPPDDVALVWLRARIDTLAERLRRDPADRPWLTGDLERSLRAMAAEREPAFAAFADVVVDVDGLDPQEAAAEIARRLELGRPD